MSNAMELTYPKFKGAVVQAAPVYGNLEATAAKATAIIAEAAGNGAKLVVFPEAFLPGYPGWIWFNTPAAFPTLGITDHANAVDIPGPAIKAIAQAARENSIHVVMPVVERVHGSLYGSQLFFDSVGNLLGKHRKMKPCSSERFVWGEGDASYLQVVDTSIGKVGGLLGTENLHPLNVTAISSLGEQVHCASWAPMMGGVDNAAMEQGVEIASPFVSSCAGVWCLSACGIYTEEMLESFGVSCENPRFEAFLANGGHAGIWSPEGVRVTDAPDSREECILYANIDLALNVYTKYWLDPSAQYSAKPVRIVMNRNCMDAVQAIGTPDDTTERYEEILEA